MSIQFIKKLFSVELPALVVSLGLGFILGLGAGISKGLTLTTFVFLLLQPFVLYPLYRNRKKRDRPG